MQTSRSQLRFTLGVLLAVNLLNFFDRQIIGAVGESLAVEFGLKDAVLGALTTAFTLLYAVASVPLGRCADLGRRTHLLAAGVAVWSLLTALSGAAWNLTSLFVFRLGVGVGEASCAPAANSLLGDLVPRERRARALAVFMLGLPLGLSLSSLVSGWISGLWGWRMAFWVAGLPGLAVAYLCLRIPEPARGASESHAVGATRRPGNALLLVLRIPTMWWIILSGALHNFNAYALGAFLSPLLQRYHGLTIFQANLVSSLGYACGGVGLFLGGWACDRVVRHRIGGRLEVSAGALALSSACLFLAMCAPGGAVLGFAAGLLPACFFLYVYYSGVYATIQDVVEPSLRGTAMAMYFLIMYIVASQGSLVTGWVSDLYAQRYAPQVAAAAGVAVVAPASRALGLHDALTLLPLVSVALVAVLVIGSRTVRADYQRLQKWMETARTSE